MSLPLDDWKESILKTLPREPGVYKFLNETGEVIYVGKAKDLRARVASYFNNSIHHLGKTRLIVKKVSKIDFILTKNESDALLLENNLIKTLQPRYNINLKDDKSYPYIVVRKENFPRVYPTRRYFPGSGEYFGPYTSVGVMRDILNLVKSLYKLRTCSLNLHPGKIKNNKYKVCLEFHIGNCAGPCVGKQSEEDYMKQIKQIKEILRGRMSTLRQFLRALMAESAQKLAFEEAQRYKEMLEKLDSFKEKSAVVLQEVSDADVFFLEVNQDFMIISYLKLTEGNLIQGYTSEIRKSADESPEEIIGNLMLNIREKFKSESSLVLSNIQPAFTLPFFKVEIPQSGEKKRLLDMAAHNAFMYRNTQMNKLSVTDPESHSEKLLALIQKDLKLPCPPHRIECFDNSNFQGKYPVSAMVCFINARPAKSEYRIFNVQEIEGPDDYETMRQVIYRRYKRVLEEGGPLPDLVVIDGGKGQLRAAWESMEQLNITNRISLISIAKRLEEIYYPGDDIPLYIDKKSETLRVIQRLRDEAHRFGLRHYRKKHKKTMTTSSLENIEGIGRSTADLLLREFKSIARIRNLDFETLASVIGPHKAGVIKKYFESENN